MTPNLRRQLIEISARITYMLEIEVNSGGGYKVIAAFSPKEARLIRAALAQCRGEIEDAIAEYDPDEEDNDAV